MKGQNNTKRLGVCGNAVKENVGEVCCRHDNEFQVKYDRIRFVLVNKVEICLP